MNFAQYLANALMADYFSISYEVKQSSTVNFLVSTAMADQFGGLFSALNFEFTGFECTDAPEEYMWIEFGNEAERDKADVYFSNFNFSARKQAMILTPDIYEGRSNPNLDVCNQYLRRIEHFFRANFDGSVFVPAGCGEFGDEERQFMVYTKAGMQGLHKESTLIRR